MLGIAANFSPLKAALRTPATASPGQPFVSELLIENETEGRVVGAFVLLALSEQARFVDGSFSINGRVLARSLVERGDSEVRLKLPPLEGKAGLRVSWAATVDVPADDADEVTLTYVVTREGERLSNDAVIHVESATIFDGENTSYHVVGDLEIAPNEQRSVRFSIVNDGSMTAYDAHLDVTGDGVALSGSAPILGALLPGDVRDVEVSVLVTGAAPALSPTLRYRDHRNIAQTFVFASTRFVPVSPARFDPTSCELRFVSSDALSPDGGVFSVEVTLTNEGARPAVRPTVVLSLPPQTTLLVNGNDAPDAAVYFPDIAPGDMQSKRLVLHTRPCEDLQIGARIGDTVLTPLIVPIKRSSSLSTLAFAASTEGPVVHTPFDVKLSVLNDGNTTLKTAAIGLLLGPDLQYQQGSLLVNGNPIPDASFVQRGELRFGDVQVGAVVELSFAVAALRPTLWGTHTQIGAAYSWEGGKRIADPLVFAVTPQAVTGAVTTLPFSILSDEGVTVVASERGEAPLLEPAALPLVVAAQAVSEPSAVATAPDVSLLHLVAPDPQVEVPKEALDAEAPPLVAPAEPAATPLPVVAPEVAAAPVDVEDFESYLKGAPAPTASATEVRLFDQAETPDSGIVPFTERDKARLQNTLRLLSNGFPNVTYLRHVAMLAVLLPRSTASTYEDLRAKLVGMVNHVFAVDSGDLTMENIADVRNQYDVTGKATFADALESLAGQLGQNDLPLSGDQMTALGTYAGSVLRAVRQVGDDRLTDEAPTTLTEEAYSALLPFFG